MKKINIGVRLKNPVFIGQIIAAVFLPIFAYKGIAVKDLTSWKLLIDLIIDAISNPYVLGLVAVSVFNAVNDPTTHGLWDSERALEYRRPK